MQFFTKEFQTFFKELASHNNTEWFGENRKRYEQHVKKPFQEFVAEIIRRVQKIDKSVKITPAEAITRINKDIRFSKDKTPYNTYVSAIISPAGKKDKSVPGLYIQLSHDKIALYGGAYVLEPPQLKKVRDKIARDPKKFRELYSDKSFKEHFGSIKGEQSKRLEPSVAAAAGKEPLIANKQFFFNTELKGAQLLKEDLADVVMSHYTAGRRLNEYLAEALS